MSLAGRAFLKRVNLRTGDRDPESGQAIRDAQATALIHWCASKDPDHSLLKAIDQPVLVVSGGDGHASGRECVPNVQDTEKRTIDPVSGFGTRRLVSVS